MVCFGGATARAGYRYLSRIVGSRVKLPAQHHKFESRPMYIIDPLQRTRLAGDEQPGGETITIV